MNNSYILTYDEFRILLYSFGITQVNGIIMEEKEFSESNVVQAMHHLWIIGFLMSEGDSFHIEDGLYQIMDVIAHALAWELLEFKRDSASYYCYIRGNDVAISEKYWNKPNSLRLHHMKLDEFNQWKERINDDHSQC